MLNFRRKCARKWNRSSVPNMPLSVSVHAPSSKLDSTNNNDSILNMIKSASKVAGSAVQVTRKKKIKSSVSRQSERIGKMIAKRRAAQLHAENPYAIRYTTGSRDRRIKNRITGLASSRLLRAGSN